MLPEEEEALRPYVFYFNNCFVSAGLVANAGGNLAQTSSQVKTVEEDSVKEFYPWNKDVQLLERILDIHDSLQTEKIMKEGKDEREAPRITEQVRISEEQVRVSDSIRQLQGEEHHFEELVDNNNNLKQREAELSGRVWTNPRMCWK